MAVAPSPSNGIWCPGCSREVAEPCHHFNCAIGPNSLAARSFPDIESLYGVLGRIDDALSQAQDCLRDETPEELTREEAREDTIDKVREAMRLTDQLRASLQPATPTGGEWDKGEHEGCGIDSQRALERRAARSFAGIDAAAEALRALDKIAAMDPNGRRADDLGRAARIASEALAALRSSDAAQAAPDLRAAAERVCWFDWSDNDPDASAAIDALRKALVVPSTDHQAGCQSGDFGPCDCGAGK